MRNLTKYPMLLTLALLMTALTVAPALVAVPVAAQPTATEWPMFMGGPQHTGYTTANPFPGDKWMVGWEFTQADGGFRSSPAISSGRVFAGSDDSYLYCVSLTDGSLIWKYKTRGGGILSSPCVYGGDVIFGAFDGYVYSLDAATGNANWEFKTGDYIYSSPIVVNGTVYIGSTDFHLYALSAATGNEIWNFSTKDSIYNVSPAYYNGYVYIGSSDFHLYKINAATGVEVWEVQGPFTTSNASSFYHSSPCVPGNGQIYIGSDDGTLYSFYDSNGTVAWYYNPDPEALQKIHGLGVQESYLESSPGYWNGMVYINFAHVMFCFNANPPVVNLPKRQVTESSPNALLWEGKTGSVSYGGAVIANSRVYVGSDDQYWYQFDALDGTRLQSYARYPRAAFKTAAAIVDGRMVTGNSGSCLICFVPGTQTALSRWVSPTTLTTGQSVSYGGGVLPAVEGATIQVTWTSPTLVVHNATATTAADGTYGGTFTPDETGLWTMQSRYPGDSTHGYSRSFPQFFTVKAAAPTKMATTITCAVNPTSSKVGDTVTISGTISPAVGGVLVTTILTKPDGTTETSASSTDKDGKFSDAFKADTAGSWSATSKWSGSASYAAATSSAASFTVTEAAGPVTPGGAAIAPEVIYGIVAVVVIAIIAVVAYMFMRRGKK